MKHFRAGDKSRGICYQCGHVVGTTFERRDVPFSQSIGVAPDILVATCDHCGAVVAIPAQSTPSIKASKHRIASTPPEETSTRCVEPVGATNPEPCIDGILRPLVFLDFDDVICLNDPYGGYDLLDPAIEVLDLYQRLFSPTAKDVLRSAVEEFDARVIITTSWLRFFDREGIERLLRATDLSSVANSLHDQWEAPPIRGATRLAAIDTWLSRFHRGEPYVILDDELSGTGLSGSKHDRAGRVVLCKVGEGLRSSHWDQISRQLRTKP